MPVNYNRQKVDEDFTKGKTFLDMGQYERAIPIFDELISFSEKVEDDEEANITLTTSLNNRGMAKCLLAKSNRDKALYESGLEDYKRSVAATPEEERTLTSSYGNLKFAEKELEDFDNLPENKPFKNPFTF